MSLPPQLIKLPADRLEAVAQALGVLEDAGVSEVQDVSSLCQAVTKRSLQAGSIVRLIDLKNKFFNGLSGVITSMCRDSDSSDRSLPPQLAKLPADRLGAVAQALGVLQEAGLSEVKDVSSLCQAVTEVSLQVGSIAQLIGLKDEFFNGLSGVIMSKSQDSDSSDQYMVQLALPPCLTISVEAGHMRVAQPDAAARLMDKASKHGSAPELEWAAAAALKLEFRMTVEQHQAARSMQGVADAAHAFAQSCSEEQLSCPNCFYSDWNGGLAMEELLSGTTLIDAQYLIALGEERGVMPRWQDLPETAKIDKRNVWRLRSYNHLYDLPILVWSYCWYSQTHPDPKGEQLEKVLPILRAMVKFAKSFSPNCTIGVVQDFGSFPQWPRSPEEQQRFSDGLTRELNQWYAHPYTNVLMFDIPASEALEHTNRRLYHERGWCYTEKHLSTLVKHRSNFLQLSLFDDSVSEWKPMREHMILRRLPPKSPDAFAYQLRESFDSGTLTFTSNADLELVIGLYKTGFINAFEKTSTCTWSERDSVVLYTSLGWGDSEVPSLKEALEYVKQHADTPLSRLGPHDVLEIDLSYNDFSEHCATELKALSNKKLAILCRVREPAGDSDDYDREVIYQAARELVMRQFML